MLSAGEVGGVCFSSSVTDIQCYRHIVFLSYSVLQTDSGVAQAVVTKAGGEREAVLCCRRDYGRCCRVGLRDCCGVTAASSSL